MLAKFRLITAPALLLLGPSLDTASAATLGTRMHLEVPVVCKLAHRGQIEQAAEGYSLGQLIEYCNAGGGFSIQVEYEPGSLQGTTVQVGDQRVVLDGSGTTTVMRSDGPKISTLDVSATTGEDKFDGTGLRFEIVPL